MTDIVSRLRSVTDLQRETEQSSYEQDDKLALEAADEITRLTELVVWHEADKVRFHDVQSAHLREIASLKAEVERLRAALEDIAYPNPVHGEDQLMQIARAALNPSQEPRT